MDSEYTCGRICLTYIFGVGRNLAELHVPLSDCEMVLKARLCQHFILALLSSEVVQCVVSTRVENQDFHAVHSVTGSQGETYSVTSEV